jgi:hypothetical protein
VITLTFTPLTPASQVLVRAAFFRICSDSSLRGPDGSIVARYSNVWHLGARSFREFRCSNSVYLRVTNQDGEREGLGPYDFVRAAEGALFTADQRLAAYSGPWGASAHAICWREVALLSAPDDTQRKACIRSANVPARV